MIDLEALRERWIAERPLYADLVREVESRIVTECEVRGLSFQVSGRPKDVASLIKKPLRKGYTSYDDIHDKAGVRIVAKLKAQIAAAEELVQSLFEVIAAEDTSTRLGPSEMGYRGVHYGVSLRGDSVPFDKEHLRGKICEIQIQTRAQNLWADTSHDLSYKPEHIPSAGVLRRIIRLVVLMELFDDEVEAARDALLVEPGFEEGRLLAALEETFLFFVAKPFDRELSLFVLGQIKDLLNADSAATTFNAFATLNGEKIREIIKDYRDDDRANPIIMQPESLAIYMLLEKEPFRLRTRWSAALPLALLEGLAAVWGVDV